MTTSRRSEDYPVTLDVHALQNSPVNGIQFTHGSQGNISTVSYVYQEQYCSCKPHTSLEKRLLLIVIVLVLVVVGLVVGLLIALGRHNPEVPADLTQAPFTFPL